MWCNWNPLKRCWYSEQIQQQSNIPSSSYFHRTLHPFYSAEQFIFIQCIVLDGQFISKNWIQFEWQQTIHGINHLQLTKTIERVKKKPYRFYTIECKQNTRNNMLDASISLIPMQLKCNTTEPPLRETHSSTIIRKIGTVRLKSRDSFSRIYAIIHQFQRDWRSH